MNPSRRTRFLPRLETGLRPPRFLFISCGGRDTGSFLRTWYLARALWQLGCSISFLTPAVSRKDRLDFALTTVTYAIEASLYRPWDFLFVNKPYPNAVVPSVLSRLMGRPVILDIDDADDSYHSGAMARFISILQEPMPGLAAVVTTHNPWLAARISSRYGLPPEDIWTIEQGVDTDFIDTLSEGPTSLRARYGLERAEVVLYTGHMNVASEFPQILRIFGGIACKRPGSMLLAAGGGPMEAEFRGIAGASGLGERVVFTGPFGRGSLGDLNAAADLCLVYYPPTEANICRVSMKLREHLAAGRHVVCNNLGDMARFAGFCHQTGGGPEAVADLACGVLAGMASGRIPRKNSLGASYVRERFSWRSIATRFLGRVMDRWMIRPG